MGTKLKTARVGWHDSGRQRGSGTDRGKGPSLEFNANSDSSDGVPLIVTKAAEQETGSGLATKWDIKRYEAVEPVV